MVNKDLVDSKRHTVSFLLKHLKEHSANQLSPLFDLITSDNFLTPPITEPMRYARLKWAEAIAALLPLNQTQNATLQILQQDPNAQIERVIQTLERTDNTNLHKIIISNPTYINYLQPDTILGLLSRLDSDLNIEISLIGQLNKGNLKTISERFTAPWVVLKKEMLTYFFKKNPECLGYAKPDVIEALAIQKQTAEPNQDMKTQSMREQLNKLQKKDEENNMPSAKYNK